MKNIAKTLLIAVIMGMSSMYGCSNDEDCPDQTFNSLADCEDATDGKKCVCVKEGSGWKAILNP